MADKKQEEPKQTTATQAAPKDLKSELYHEYAHGGVINEMADARGLDSREVLAMIQEVQAANRKK